MAESMDEAVAKLMAKPLGLYLLHPDTVAQLEAQQIVTVGDYLDRIVGRSAIDMPWPGCEQETAAEIEGHIEKDGIELDPASGSVAVKYNDERVLAAVAALAPAVEPKPAKPSNPMSALRKIPVQMLDLTTATMADIALNGCKSVGALLEVIEAGKLDETIIAKRTTPKTTRDAIVAALRDKGIVVSTDNKASLLVEGAKDVAGSEPISADQAGTSTENVRPVEPDQKTPGETGACAPDSSGSAPAVPGEDIQAERVDANFAAGDVAGQPAGGEPAVSEGNKSDGACAAKLADLKELALKVQLAKVSMDEAKATYKSRKKYHDALCEQLTENAVNADQFDLLTNLHGKADPKPKVEPAPASATGTAFDDAAWESLCKPYVEKYHATPLTELIPHGVPKGYIKTLAEDHHVLTIGDINAKTEKNAQYKVPWWEYMKGFGAGKADKIADAMVKVWAALDAEIRKAAESIPGAMEYMKAKKDK